MAAPNLVNVTSIYGKTVGADLGTGNTNILICGAEKVIKVNSIIVSNVDGASAFDVTVVFYNHSSTANIHIAKTVSVPADATLVVITKDSSIYLEEDMAIFLTASAAGDLSGTCSYDEISE